ncbi:MAG: hypothetical protein IPP72_10950 [Chitinophagaceae bacterium]|nr:hypothetical protein [Chitinophagaceae bacterium]
MEADAAKCPEKFSATFFRLLLLTTATIILFSCKRNQWIEVDPAFSRYIDAYTTGTVSKPPLSGFNWQVLPTPLIQWEKK